MWLTCMWSRTNQEIRASVLKRILLNIITPLVCTTVLHTKPFHPQQYPLSIRQRPTYTQETILRLGSRFPVRAEKSCFAPIPRPPTSGGHTSGIKAAMAYKLHIPDCILEPHHPFHFPTPNKPLRIRIQGPLISIQRLIRKHNGTVIFRLDRPPKFPRQILHASHIVQFWSSTWGTGRPRDPPRGLWLEKQTAFANRVSVWSAYTTNGYFLFWSTFVPRFLCILQLQGFRLLRRDL